MSFAKTVFIRTLLPSADTMGHHSKFPQHNLLVKQAYARQQMIDVRGNNLRLFVR